MTVRPKGPGEAAGDRDELLDAIGVRVREFRRAASLTQKGLADAAGLTQAYVYLVETGGQNLTVSVLARLAKAMGASVRSLLPEEAGAVPSDESLERVATAFEQLRTVVEGHRKDEATILEAFSRMATVHEQLATYLQERRPPKKAVEKGEKGHTKM